MKCKICLSVGSLGPEFEKMAESLSRYAEVEVVGLSDFSLQGVDIFIGKKLDEEILATADRLKAVFAYKTGVDDFPLKEFKERNILLFNSHIDADYIAEYAFGLSISLVNRITECDKKLRRGIWYDTKNPYWKSIFDIKIGLLGYGHIGRQIHQILAKNHIDTYTIDRGKKYENIKLVDSLEELCKETTLIIVSLPKTPETDTIINEEMFWLLKDKYIVNVGRSNCIDQRALYEALKTGWLAGAAIDTWDKKPKNPTESLQPSKYPFTELENIVLSPHQAMRVNDGHARYVEDTEQKVISYLAGEMPTDLVNLEKGY